MSFEIQVRQTRQFPKNHVSKEGEEQWIDGFRIQKRIELSNKLIKEERFKTEAETLKHFRKVLENLEVRLVRIMPIETEQVILVWKAGEPLP